MPDDRDFVQKLKKKASKKEKAEKYGQPYKQKWLQANERFLGSDRLDAALKEQDSWEKDFSAKRKLEAEPFAESSQKKKSKAVEHVATVEEARRNRLYAQVIADGLKAYVSLKTSKGDLNFEIFCSKAPRAAENFLGLCQKGYYNGVTFHRLVPGLMVQGGDPTGTGRGGESLWSGPFPSEIAEDLSHNRAGVLSMANAGKDLNKSQFFITFGACAQLDGKHPIFGQLVGGAKVLKDIEGVPTNELNQPKVPITILKAVVHANPFQELADKVKGKGVDIAPEQNPYLQHHFK